MGYWKNRQIEMDEYFGLAQSALAAIDAISLCERCGATYGCKMEAQPETYARAVAMAKKMYPVDDFKLLSSCIKEVLDETMYSNDCPCCGDKD